jgi:hypothetical protein
MGGKKKTLQLLQQQACSVSRALWPADVRHCLSTGKAAQSRRLLIMNGIYLATIQVKRPRRCAYCQHTIEYVRYVKIVHHVYSARSVPYRQAFYLSLAFALLAGGVSLALVYHWSLALLLVVVWLATAFVTSQLLASDMHFLRRMGVILGLLVHAVSLRVAMQGRAILSFLHRRRRLKPARRPLIKGSRVFMPMQFPETPMPATPLIRVLETIDLSSTSVEHFLEEEKQTSGEMPIVHELPSRRSDL